MGLLGAAANDVVVKITGDESHLLSTLRKSNEHINSSTKKWEQDFGKLASVGAPVIATVTAIGAATVALGVRSSAEFAKSERVWGRLGAQAKALQMDFRGLEPQIRATTVQLQRMTGLGDEDIAAAFTVLLRNTQNVTRSQELLTTVVDLAAAKNIDLASSAEIVSKAYYGQGRALREMGIEVKDGEQAMADLQRRVQGIGAELGSDLVGRFGYLKQASGNLLESLGGVIIGGDGAKDTITQLGDAVQKLAEKLERNEGGLSRWAAILKAVATMPIGGAAGAIPAIRAANQRERRGPLDADEQEEIKAWLNSLGPARLPALTVDVSEDNRIAREKKRIQDILDQRRREAERVRQEQEAAEFLRADQNRFAMRHYNLMNIPTTGSLVPSVFFRTPNPGMARDSVTRGAPRRASAIGAGGGGRPGEPSLLDKLGGHEGALLLAMQAFQGAASGNPLEGILGAVTSAGFAVGGPAGLGVAAGGMILSTLSRLFGNSRDREEEAYRAHRRALLDAAAAQPVIQLFFPPGALYDTNNPDFQEAIVETLQNATGNRIGRVQVIRTK